MGASNMTSDDSPARYLTTAEAAEYLRYSRADAFLRAWRARGLSLYQRPAGHYLVSLDDVDRFLRPVGSQVDVGQPA